MSDHRNILLVEDDEYDIELTLAALSGHHIANQVVVVNDGEAALDYLFRRGAFANRDNENPLLVLLDLKLPKVDGLEVLRQVKASEALKTIPIVMLTSSREEGDLVTSYQLGVNAYVVKPLEFEEFMEKVGKVGLFWSLINHSPPTSPPQ